jgi:seryl-tRNA synthetase
VLEWIDGFVVGKQLKEQVAELEGKLTVLSKRLQREGQRNLNMTHPSIHIGSVDVASIRKEVTLSMSRIFNVSVCSSRSGFMVSKRRAVKVKLKQRGQVGRQQQFTFPVKDHVELGLALDLFDFEAASKVCSAWPYPFESS